MDKWSGFSTRHLNRAQSKYTWKFREKIMVWFQVHIRCVQLPVWAAKQCIYWICKPKPCLIHSHTMFQTLKHCVHNVSTLKHKYWPCPKSVDHGRRIFHGLRLTLLTLSPKNQHYHHTSSPTCCSTIGPADFGPVEIELRSSLTTYMLQLLHVVALAPGIPMSNGLLVSTSWVQYPSIPACQLRSPTGKGSSPSLRNNGR